MEKLHCGWLTKSPPEKKTQRLFPAKWRRRYFVLYVPPSSRTLPIRTCTAILDYYSNDKMITKRGSIDLEKCHSIKEDINNTYHKHTFVMKTVHKDKERDYFLASESKQEMDEWVNILCNIVGLSKESFNGLTPTRNILEIIPPKDLDILSHCNSTVQPGYKEDYFDLKDCTGRSPGVNEKKVLSGYKSENDQIQIYQLPKSNGGVHISSSGSSNVTDSNEFQAVEDVYNIPRNQVINDEYKMPKQWRKLHTSTSSELDEGPKENVRSPSSSSPSASSMTFNDTYDMPPPKSHIPSSYGANSYTTSSLTSPHDVPLPLKVRNKGSHKKNGFSQNGSSSSSDAFKRVKHLGSTSQDSNSSSSSSSDDDDDETDGSLKFDAIYRLPRKSSDLGRDALPSVFEEFNDEKIQSDNKNQKVQYLHLDFSEGTHGIEATNSKPTPGNKVEYKEIDFEKTKALSEIRVNREITKSQ